MSQRSAVSTLQNCGTSIFIFFEELYLHLILELRPLSLQSSVLSPQEAITEAPDPSERAKPQPQAPGAPIEQVGPGDDGDTQKGSSIAPQPPAIATQAESSESKTRD